VRIGSASAISRSASAPRRPAGYAAWRLRQQADPHGQTYEHAERRYAAGPAMAGMDATADQQAT